MAIDRLLESSAVVRLDIDTRLVPNPLGLRSPEEIESLIARLDVVVSTRLHAMVHALKHGVPVLAIDPIARGGKVLAQARSIGWPIVFSADTLDDAQLRRALEYCATPEARAVAQECAARAREGASEVERRFKAFLS
jgi:polysaccharide pyruvyl transferase WcaK-like protein